MHVVYGPQRFVSQGIEEGTEQLWRGTWVVSACHPSEWRRSQGTNSSLNFSLMHVKIVSLETASVYLQLKMAFEATHILCRHTVAERQGSMLRPEVSI